MQTLPLFIASAAASDVTFGRLSYMIATSPSGTCFLQMCMPFACTVSEMMRPVWSGSFTVALIPSAMPSMRAGSSLSLSSMTSEIPPRALSMSCSFAASILSVSCCRASAIASRMRFFSSGDASRMLPHTALVTLRSSSVVIFVSLLFLSKILFRRAFHPLYHTECQDCCRLRLPSHSRHLSLSWPRAVL